MKHSVHPIKRIGIDLDNTVADYMAGAIPLLKEHYNLEPDFSTPAYKIEEVFGLTKETRPPNMRQHLYEDLHLFRQLPKMEPDIEQLTQTFYHKPWHKVYFITARTGVPIIVEDTIFWLHKNGFFFDDIFFTDNKDELCQMMRIDVMFEDEVGQLLNLRRAGIDVVVPDQPWNRHLPDDPHHKEQDQGRVTRVSNWREALVAIEEYLE
jgi:5'(3')-deoxyribonucleotidase